LEKGSQLALETYLLGQVVSSLLIVREKEPLHATVVSRGRKAVAFLGDSGFGKTTLASYLLNHGFRLITDDLLVMTRASTGYLAHHGVPRVKLYPDSAAIFGRDSARGEMNPFTRKCVFDIDPLLFDPEDVPLQAFFSIVPAAPSDLDDIRIRRLTPREAFESLSANCYNPVHSDVQRLSRHFEIVPLIARECQMFSLQYPRRFDVFPALLTAINERLAEGI